MTSGDRLDDLLSLWQARRDRGETADPQALCRDCPELAAELGRRIAALERLSALARPTPSGLAAAVTLASAADPAGAAADTAGPTPSPPGFALLGELGRGGMGVVYLARQVRLNRLVALKMILAGEHAAPDALARFLREAEVIARLRHPHVVQVYEFGTHAGRPYFALEYLAGGSLEKHLAGRPQPPREAAALVRTLAEAMQHAHDQGIVHRDLKPANVLLERSPTPLLPNGGKGVPESDGRNAGAAPGSPAPADGAGAGGWGRVKIADFGLAKAADSGMTASGAVLGTPSYMAPEQARGDTAHSGPLADVYALGAILYECLTGRPPFKAATAVETVLQVTEQEPPAVRLLQATVPADLETICHKCLEKEPRRRYASAQALADDLGRFLAGEPIGARPVGWAERGGRWCRRHPLPASLAAAALAALLGGLLGMTLLYLQAEEQRQEAVAAQARAEAERRRADLERDQAQTFAAEARRQQQAADAQADRARQVTRFLTGLFEASDPLGLNGFTGGLTQATGETLTARELLRRGAQQLETPKALGPLTRADLLDTVGDVHRSIGDYPQSERLLDEALDLRRRHGTPAELATSLHHRAWLHHERGEYTDALRLYREALALRKALTPPDEPAVATTQFNLAWVLAELEEYAQAEPLFLETLALRQKCLGPRHRETALAQGALAALYLDTDRPLAAMPYFNAALQTLLDKEKDAKLWKGIGLFMNGVVQGNQFHHLAGAERTLRQSLDLIRQALGPRHLYVTMPLCQLALVVEEAGRPAEAEALYREVLDLARQGVGLGHPKVLIPLEGLSRTCCQRRAGAEADALFEAVLAAHRARFKGDHPLVADVLVEYADHLQRCQASAREKAARAEALAIYRRAEGPPRHRFVVSLAQLGHAHYRAGEYPAAEALYREALAAARRRYPGPHPELALSLHNLATSLTRQGRYAEAAPLLAEAESLLPRLDGAGRAAVAHDLALARADLLLARDRDAAGAAAALAAYRQTLPAEAGRCVDVAARLARCYDLAQAAPAPGAAQPAEGYAAEAVALLRQARSLGADPRGWGKDPQFRALRDREDFGQLVPAAP